MDANESRLSQLITELGRVKMEELGLRRDARALIGSAVRKQIDVFNSFQTDHRIKNYRIVFVDSMIEALTTIDVMLIHDGLLEQFERQEKLPEELLAPLRDLKQAVIAELQPDKTIVIDFYLMDESIAPLPFSIE